MMSVGMLVSLAGIAVYCLLLPVAIVLVGDACEDMGDALHDCMTGDEVGE